MLPFACRCVYNCISISIIYDISHISFDDRLLPSLRKIAGNGHGQDSLAWRGGTKDVGREDFQRTKRTGLVECYDLESPVWDECVHRKGLWVPHTEISKYEKIKSFSYIFISFGFKGTIWRWFNVFLLQSVILFYQQYVVGSTEHSDSDLFQSSIRETKHTEASLTLHSPDKNGWKHGQVLQALESCCHGSDTSSGASVLRMIIESADGEIHHYIRLHPASMIFKLHVLQKQRYMRVYIPSTSTTEDVEIAWGCIVPRSARSPPDDLLYVLNCSEVGLPTHREVAIKMYPRVACCMKLPIDLCSYPA